jgi:hypothetical protein
MSIILSSVQYIHTHEPNLLPGAESRKVGVCVSKQTISRKLFVRVLGGGVGGVGGRSMDKKSGLCTQTV